MVLSRARIAAAASVLFLLVAGAWGLRFQGNDRAEGLRVSGNIEATTVEVSFRIPGRIEIRAVDEGMKVAAGQLVARLDNADLVDELRLREAELAEAVRLSHAGVYSPLSGTVLSKNAEPGEYVAAGTPVVTIGDLQDVWLRAYIPETELGKVKVGQPVSVGGAVARHAGGWSHQDSMNPDAIRTVPAGETVLKRKPVPGYPMGIHRHNGGTP